jgi:hypothetical protein
MNNYHIQKGNYSNKFIAGFILIAAGLVLLLAQMDLFFFPGWLISWPMLLIVIGVYSGLKHNFRNFSWFLMVFIGCIFLANRVFPGLYISAYIWPLGIIAVGVWLIVRRNEYLGQNHWNKF